MIEKERKEAEEIDKRFGLTSEDIENIFDLIEGEQKIFKGLAIFTDITLQWALLTQHL